MPTPSSTGDTTAKQAKGSTSDAASLLKSDHRAVEALFQRYGKSEAAEEKQQIAREICQELIVHTLLEEEIFYPACREKQVQDNLLDEAQVEHDGAKILITQIMTLPASSAFYDAKVNVLREYIRHHVGEEEKPGGGIFAKARKAGVDMSALGEKLQARKAQLKQQGESQGFAAPAPRSLELATGASQSNLQEQTMARQQDRERDEQGRFMSEDDRDDRSRGRYADEGYSPGRGRYGSRNERERDDQGRFMSEDDNGGSFERGYGRSRYENEDRGYGRSSRYEDDRFQGDYGSYGRSRGSEDYERGQSYGGGRGQGDRGWFGDPEGHSRASREGWEDRGRYSRGEGYSRGESYGRGEGSGRGEDYERSGGYGRGEDYGERGRGGRMSGGRDYDERSSRGGQGSGWYGDPQGHSEASRRGWEERGGGRSSRDEDDDDRGGSRSGGGNGGRGGRGGSDNRGWYGDSRRHAEAARRGWQNRD